MIFASSLLFNCWEFASRHPGILLVLLGVAGEVVFDWKEMKGRLAWAKRMSALILIAGLILEFSEAAKSDKDVSAAMKAAGQTNERASTNELRVAELQSNNIVLETQLEKLRHPRIITSEERERIIGFLSDCHNVSKIRIEVIIGNNDRETERFAFQVRKVLDEAGYGDVPSKYQSPLVQMADNSVYVTYGWPHIDLPTFEWNDAKLLKVSNLSMSPLQCGKESGLVTKAPTGATDLASENPFTDRQPEIIALFSEKIPPASILPSVIVFYPTDNNPNRGFHYGYSPTKDPNAILYGICAVFNESGITVGKNIIITGILPPGRVAFFIPSQ